MTRLKVTVSYEMSPASTTESVLLNHVLVSKSAAELSSCIMSVSKKLLLRGAPDAASRQCKIRGGLERRVIGSRAGVDMRLTSYAARTGNIEQGYHSVMKVHGLILAPSVDNLGSTRNDGRQ